MKIEKFGEYMLIAEAYESMLNGGEMLCETMPTRDAEGYDQLGFDVNGYDRDGMDVLGCGRDGMNKDGRDALGYDKDGWNAEGFPSPVLNPQAYGLSTPEEGRKMMDDKILELKRKARAKLSLRRSYYLNHDRALERARNSRIRNRDKIKAARYAKNHTPEKEAERERRKQERAAEIERRRADKERERSEYLASEEGQRELRAKRDEHNKSRHNDEYRKYNRDYIRDYRRAIALLNHTRHATIDDVLFMHENPTYKHLAELRKRKNGEYDGSSERTFDDTVMDYINKMRADGKMGQIAKLRSLRKFLESKLGLFSPKVDEYFNKYQQYVD